MKKKNTAAQALGALGGAATAANRTPKQRTEAARKAALARHHPLFHSVPKKKPRKKS